MASMSSLALSTIPWRLQKYELTYGSILTGSNPAGTSVLAVQVTLQLSQNLMFNFVQQAASEAVSSHGSAFWWFIHTPLTHPLTYPLRGKEGGRSRQNRVEWGKKGEENGLGRGWIEDRKKVAPPISYPPSWSWFVFLCPFRVVPEK